MSPMTTLIATTVALQHIFLRFLEKGPRKLVDTAPRKEIPRPNPLESQLSFPCPIINIFMIPVLRSNASALEQSKGYVKALDKSTSPLGYETGS
jgi:hypothetical protein